MNTNLDEIIDIMIKERELIEGIERKFYELKCLLDDRILQKQIQRNRMTTRGKKE